MRPCLKSLAPEDFLRELDRLEEQADRCYERLELLREPQNLASWAALTTFVEAMERTHQTPNSFPLFRAAMMNLGRTGALLIHWIGKHGSQGFAPRSKFRWSPRLAKAAGAALDVAHAYESFLSLFPSWHKDRALGEIVGPNRIRFTASRGPNDRRVSAFHKGMYPASGPYNPPPYTSPVKLTPELEVAFAAVIEGAKRDGPFGFTYVHPTHLYEALAPPLAESLASLFRRDVSCDLGGYSLQDVKSFYAVLLAISMVHLHLCRLWSEGNRFPLSAAVLVKERRSWIKEIATLSGLSLEMTEAILKNLTFPAHKPYDLHVHPFVSLDCGDRLLGLIPHIPLNSRPDENVIRVCSYTNRRAFDMISLSKEEEMREDLSAALPPRFKPAGPVPLPPPNPDVDFIVEDQEASVVLIAELKWIRKPISAWERLDRDEEFLKGVTQLRGVQRFLKSQPRFLVDGDWLSAALDAYSEVQYLLIARDHFAWVDPDADFPVVEHEVLKTLLRKHSDLRSVVTEILSFNWLPVEGTDFLVRFESAEANRVVVESEIFYSSQALRAGGG
jgi:hypothetical protein